ncbi:RDD family protein [Saliniramus sp.]|uniref:RDD family protein n=1 Tax=Saliniramus sp. TaxID=2986772 RepID=UPI002C40083F|nr:RDD family protein [Saliniramus sp.]HMB10541.1 RDD family protein [Saliniramus sp.]
MTTTIPQTIPLAAGGATGVLGRRFVALLIDLLIIMAFIVVLAFAITILGFLTFGLGWLLFAILGPGAAILYTALTMGGPAASTIGMRLCGLRVVDAASGEGIDPLRAAAHALLFYFAASTFLILLVDVVIGFLRGDARLGRDLIVNLIVLRAHP